MKHSLRVRITSVLTVLTMLTIFLCWFINKTFLGDFYLYSKTKTLGEAYDSVAEKYSKIDSNSDTISESDALKLEILGVNKNISIYVLDPSLNLLYPLDITVKQYQQIYNMVQEYRFTGSNKDIKSKEIIKSENLYKIYRIFDGKMESNYIDLVGYLDNGFYIYMRTNLESIQESVQVANNFLAYVGILVTFVGTLVMFFISRDFTKPILELSEIAKKMSNLDFDVKYPVTSKDEIGQLGTSINTLSEKLEETISELKSANNELKSDIENKIQIDEMRTEFLSNVTHELKTPIALIQGYAEGLKDNINDDEESRNFYCEVIVDEAMKMNKMVKKLLSLNQIEYGNNQINFERFDIVELIKSVLSSTELFFQQKNVILHFEDYDPIYVWADEYMVEEVITNYISNALNHVSGKNIIEVKLIKKEDVVRIAVFNTGENIPEEDIDNIWIKFYKVDKARTREYGGNGIGLSIVKAIMTSLNRECGVMNRPTGVEFWFELDTKI